MRWYWCGLGVAVMAACAAPAMAAENAEVALGHTVITSRSLTYDYKRASALFEQDVVVRDPAVRMESERLNVLMSGTNAVRSITATGNVRFWHEDKEGRCDKAIYISRTGEVILMGNAQLLRGKDAIRGREITFSIFDDKVTCTPATLVIYSEEAAVSGGLGGGLPGAPSSGRGGRRP